MIVAGGGITESRIVLDANMRRNQMTDAKSRAFDRTIEHLKKATQDFRRREQLRARVGLRTMRRFLKIEEDKDA